MIITFYCVEMLFFVHLEKKEHQNSGTLGKDTINHWIISFLRVEKRFNFNKGVQPDVYFLDVT